MPRKTKHKTKKKTKNKSKQTKLSHTEWGLGVEHELILTFQGLKSDSDYHNLLEILLDTKLNQKQKNELSHIYEKYNQTLAFVIPYYSELDLNYINLERTTKNKLPIYEIKTLKYKNVKLDNLVEELDNQKQEMLNKLEKLFFERFPKLKDIRGLKIDETPNGAHNLLFLNCSQKLDEDEFNCLESFSNLKLSSDYTGSYHFWISFPEKIINQKAMYLLQTLEPLFCSLFCASDPKIGIDNKTRLKSSFRSAHNFWAGFGTGQIFDYDSYDLGDRRIRYISVKPKKMGQKTYINQVASKLTEKIDNSNRVNYEELLNNNPNRLGSDFRRKDSIKGFEFRIWDHFPQTNLKDILKIVYLVACYACELDKDDLEFSLENNGWNQAMASALLEGYQMKIPIGYLGFISKQFQINRKKLKNKDSLELLKSIIDYLLSIIEKNKNNLYWSILDTMSNKKIKIPEINKKSILDTS